MPNGDTCRSAGQSEDIDDAVAVRLAGKRRVDDADIATHIVMDIAAERRGPGHVETADDGRELQFEGSVAYQLSRQAVVGAEFRSKPDNLGFGEDDWMDIFAAYAVNDHITVTAAYADLGSIATFENQCGGFLSAQIAF